MAISEDPFASDIAGKVNRSQTGLFFLGRAFAEYVVLPAINVDRGMLRLPDSVSFDAGTFVEPLGCVVRGQHLAPVSDGRSVLVIGAGITGLLHIQAARLNGAGFIAVFNPSPERLKIARTFGADATISATEDVPEKFKELNGGPGADTVIMTAPVPMCVKQSLEAVGPGGTILFFVPTNPEIRSEFNLWNLWQKEITITHSYAADPSVSLFCAAVPRLGCQAWPCMQWLLYQVRFPMSCGRLGQQPMLLRAASIKAFRFGKEK